MMMSICRETPHFPAVDSTGEGLCDLAGEAGVPSESAARATDMFVYSRVVSASTPPGGRKREGTVTRMGRDRASGLGSAEPTRARSRQGRALPHYRHRRHGPPNTRHPGWNPGPTPVFRNSATDRGGDRSPRRQQQAGCEVAEEAERNAAMPRLLPLHPVPAGTVGSPSPRQGCGERISGSVWKSSRRAGDNSAVIRACVAVVPLVDVPADHLQGHVGISAARALALAIVAEGTRPPADSVAAGDGAPG